MWEQRNEGCAFESNCTTVVCCPFAIVCKKHFGGAPATKTSFGYAPVRGAVAADAVARTAKASVSFIEELCTVGAGAGPKCDRSASFSCTAKHADGFLA